MKPVLTIILTLLFTTPLCHAQTEVEGEVSGVWDIDGSPYVLVDTVIVPEDEELTIDPGVEVEFGEDMLLLVEGNLTAVGTEDDTIYFMSGEDTISGSIWLEFDGEEDTVSFAFCRFDSLRLAIYSEDCPVFINNCLFNNNSKALRLRGNFVNCSDNTFVRNSSSLGYRNPERRGTYIISDNTLFKSSFNVDMADEVIFNDNLAIRHTEDGFRPRYSSVSFSGCEIILFQNNINVEYSMSNILRRLEEAIVVDNLMNRATINTVTNNDLTFRRNTIYQHINIYDAEVTISDNVINEEIYLGTIWTESSVSINHNILFGGIKMEGRIRIEVVDNTLIGTPFDSFIHSLSAQAGGNCSASLHNNIFYTTESDIYGVCQNVGAVDGSYNCFWGVEEAYEGDEDIFEGDILEDPRFVGGDPYEYQLQANSPCIDAGDPDSPEDPDGTRTDMGYYFYDQENGMPPVIISPYYKYTGWGMDFSYVTKVNDWDGAIDIEFEGLPDWLEVANEGIRRDFVEDSVVISGEVPQNQEDFVFIIRARDEDSNTLSASLLLSDDNSDRKDRWCTDERRLALPGG